MSDVGRRNIDIDIKAKLNDNPEQAIQFIRFLVDKIMLNATPYAKSKFILEGLKNGGN